MIAPPPAGPIMRAAAATVELIEIARGSASRSTSSETNVWRVGTSIARARPRPSASTQTRGSVAWCVRAAMPRMNASADWLRLRAEQELALVGAVGERAGPRAEEEDGQRLQRDRDPERGAGGRELQDEPRLGHRLEPGAGDRDQLPGEVEAVVPGAEGSGAGGGGGCGDTYGVAGVFRLPVDPAAAPTSQKVL